MVFAVGRCLLHYCWRLKANLQVVVPEKVHSPVDDFSVTSSRRRSKGPVVRTPRKVSFFSRDVSYRSHHFRAALSKHMVCDRYPVLEEGGCCNALPCFAEIRRPDLFALRLIGASASTTQPALQCRKKCRGGAARPKNKLQQANRTNSHRRTGKLGKATRCRQHAFLCAPVMPCNELWLRARGRVWVMEEKAVVSRQI